VLARDESFHVPLNVHFMRQVSKMRGVYHVLYSALIGSAYASRKVAFNFEHIPFKELAGAHATGLVRDRARLSACAERTSVARVRIERKQAAQERWRSGDQHRRDLAKSFCTWLAPTQTPATMHFAR